MFYREIIAVYFNSRTKHKTLREHKGEFNTDYRYDTNNTTRHTLHNHHILLQHAYVALMLQQTIM